MKLGAEIVLEGFTSVDQIDQNYGYLEGRFGRVEFGSRNSAAYQMHYAAPFVGIPINSGWVTSFVPANTQIFGIAITGYPTTVTAPVPGSGFLTPLLSTYLDFGDDENLISYYSPRVAGFQFGVSYAPTINDSGDGKNFPAQADQNTEYSNGVSVGLNFVETFNGVDIAVAGGYQWAEAPESFVCTFFFTCPASGSWSPDNYQAWSAGVNLGYAGVTFGGSFAQVLEGKRYGSGTSVVGTIGGLSSTEGSAWDVGAAYTRGPWSFGVTYFEGKIEGLKQSDILGIPEFFDVGQNELRALQAGIGYALGPGINVSASLLWADWRDEYHRSFFLPPHGGNRDGLVGVVGMTVNF